MSDKGYQWPFKVASHISDYFKCWKGCINELRDVVFGHMKVRYHVEKSTTDYTNSKPITYDAMITILEKMVELGAAADELFDGDAQDYNQEEWMDYHALKSLGGNRVLGMEWDFPKVETFRIMDAIERSLAPVPVTSDGHFGSSDIPLDEYSADPYHGGQPDVGDIVKHYDSSIRTSVLPSSSGAITSFPSSTDMPPTSMPSTSMAPISSLGKQMGPGSPLPPPNDDSDDGPQRKKPRQTQPSKQPPRKGKVISTSLPALLKIPHRAYNSSRGSKATTSMGGWAPTSRHSCRSRRDDDPDSEHIPPEAKTPGTIW